MAEREFIVTMKNGKPHIKCPTERDKKGNLKVFVPNLSEVEALINKKEMISNITKEVLNNIKQNGKRNLRKIQSKLNE